jgi:tetratricopeptide (TPR) repeat protein
MLGQQMNAVLAGQQLTAQEAGALEVAASPGDVMSRLRLLGYYFGQRPRNRGHVAHALWFIETAPELDVIGTPFVQIDRSDPQYHAACEAWNRVLGRESLPPRVFLHAARFFTLADPDLCTQLLERGERAAPTWPEWAQQLGENGFRALEVSHKLVASGASPKHTPEQLSALAKEALGHFERALSLAPSAGRRFSILPSCAKAALGCGQLDDALRYADATIALAPECREDRHVHDRTHEAHIVRGHVALINGDVGRARSELAIAGEQGRLHAPVLRSFGPDVRLAQRLLEADELDAVRAYLEQCATFWKPDRIRRWLDAIARGERPRLFTGYDPSERVRA